MKDTNEPRRHVGKAALFLLLAMFCLFLPATLDAAGPQPQNAPEPPGAPSSYEPMGSPVPHETEGASVSAGAADNAPSGTASIPNASDKAVSPSDATPPKQPAVGTGLVQEGSHFVLYIEGKPVTEPGWKELQKQKFFIDSYGHAAAKMEHSGNVWKFFKYNATAAAWEKQRDLWEPVLAKLYYFNKSGNCTMVYDTETEQLKVRKNGKMRLARRAVYPLHNGKLYYFQKNGTRQTSSGWKKASSSERYYVHKKGYVTSKMVKSKNIWRYYTYQYGEAKWEKQRNVWKSVDGKKYYFNKSGKCTRIYNPDTENCQRYHDGKMAAVKNNLCRLPNGKLYYFNAKGTRVTEKGWQEVSASQYMQLGKKGYVIAKLEKKSSYWKFYKYDYPK